MRKSLVIAFICIFFMIVLIVLKIMHGGSVWIYSFMEKKDVYCYIYPEEGDKLIPCEKGLNSPIDGIMLNQTTYKIRDPGFAIVNSSLHVYGLFVYEINPFKMGSHRWQDLAKQVVCQMKERD